MSKESNYFEEAYCLCNDSDWFVANTAKALYEQMHARHVRDGLSPNAGFNILYFYQSVIRLLLLERNYLKLNSPRYPYSCEAIRGINYPDGFSKWNGNLLLWRRYAELVSADSNPFGDDFDVDYAIKIAASVIDDKGALRHPIAEEEVGKLDYDEWLAGFNSDQS